MAAKPKDPTEPMRLMASRFPEVAEGTACTQSSFKVGKTSFFFVGMQGGRYKLMFKLKQSLPEATRLAKKSPEDYGVGSTGWVSARFTAEKPIPKKIWAAWLKESYELSAAPKAGKTTAKKATAKKATAKKKATKKKAT